MTLAFATAKRHHEGFIVQAWSTSMKDSKHRGLIHDDDYFEVTHLQIKRVLWRNGTQTLVAHMKGDPDAYRGFICFDTQPRIPYVHYVYVKQLYRRAGHARALFEAAGINPDKPFHFSELNANAAVICEARKVPMARYEPMYVRFDKERSND